MNEKILFLDVDGVLNSKQLFLRTKGMETPGANTPDESDLNFMRFNTDPFNVWNLKYILENVPDLKIVLSSSWRNAFSMEDFKTLFSEYGIDPNVLIGKTPRRLTSYRCNEIHWWLEENDFQGTWVALDDFPIFELNENDKQHEVLTNCWTGLTLPDAIKVIKHFKPDFKEPLVMI